MEMLKTLVSLAATAIMCINLAMAANYTVGAPNGGWDQSTDLTTWASAQTFIEGDNLIFQYSQNHDVTEVSKADFDSCTATNPLQPPQTGGVAVIPLTTSGSRYFICGSSGHCLGGMKVQIDTVAASAPPPSTTPTVPTPPPTPSARRPVASPPTKSVAPSPSPKHSLSPAPKISPSSPRSKAAAGNPTSPPSSAPPPSGSLSPPPSGSLSPPPTPSSAAKFSVMGALTACYGFVLIVFLNL